MTLHEYLYLPRKGSDLDCVRDLTADPYYDARELLRSALVAVQNAMNAQNRWKIRPSTLE